MQIKSNEAVGLIIDVQERLFPVMYEKEGLEKNTGILIEGLKVLGIPLLVTEQYTKGLGHTIEALQTKLYNAGIFEKICFSCVKDADFLKELKNNNKKYVIIAGIESHICVLQTVTDLLAEGFVPVVVADCVASRVAYNKEIALERMRQEGAIITTCESVLFEMTVKAGTEEFKQIAKLIK